MCKLAKKSSNTMYLETWKQMLRCRSAFFGQKMLRQTAEMASFLALSVVEKCSKKSWTRLKQSWIGVQNTLLYSHSSSKCGPRFAPFQRVENAFPQCCEPDATTWKLDGSPKGSRAKPLWELTPNKQCFFHQPNQAQTCEPFLFPKCPVWHNENKTQI